MITSAVNLIILTHILQESRFPRAGSGSFCARQMRAFPFIADKEAEEAFGGGCRRRRMHRKAGDICAIEV